MHTSHAFRHARYLLVFASVLAAAACGSSSNTGTSSTATGGTSSTSTTSTTGPGTTGSGAASGTGGSGGQSNCPVAPNYPGNGQALLVDKATAVVTDPNGAPISGLEVQLCGINICNTGMTDASGNVTVPGDGTTKLTQPVLKIGDALTYAKLGIPVTTAMPSFPNLVDIALPTMGTAFTPGGTSVSGGVTLTLPAGDVVTVDTLNYDTPDKQLFRAVQIPVDKEMPVTMPSGLTIGILVGVAPLETTFCPAVGVTVPNTAGWPASTAVEFYLHGVDTLQAWSMYGAWTKISDGQVSADGMTVSTSAGQGFPVLESFAVVQKQ